MNKNKHYLISDASRQVQVEAHVLRYWEDELGMEIHRNSLGHRCYTAQDIQIFLGIRELKDDLLEAIGIEPCNVCTYCFNGKE